MQLMKLCFVSSNEGKISEAKEALGIDIEIAKISLDEIQSLDLEEIVRAKALEAYRIIKKPLIVDDAGLFFNVWNGFPGPFIKHLVDVAGYEALQNMLGSGGDRKITAKSAIGFHDGKKVHTFLGEVHGIYLTEARGDDGWGFDPYFLPDGYSQTFAQMGPEGKNKISHRAMSLSKFKEFLATS